MDYRHQRATRDPISHFCLNIVFSARSTRLGRRKYGWQSFEIYCQPWSPNQPVISQKMAPISAEKMGTMGNVCSWFLHLVSRNGPLGSVRGVDLTRPVRINYQHQRQLLSFALTCQSDHPCRRQVGHQYFHKMVFKCLCIECRFCIIQCWRDANLEFLSYPDLLHKSCDLEQLLFLRPPVHNFTSCHLLRCSSHVLPGFLPSPSRANIQIWTHV